jgi:hypothetical protein
MFQDASHLAPSGVLVGYLAEGRDQYDGVEHSVGVRQYLRVGAGWLDVLQPSPMGATHRCVEHLLLDVEDVETAIRADPLRERQCVVPGAGADLEDPLTGLGIEDLA